MTKCMRILNDYILHSDGDVYSLKSGRYLEGSLDKDGYRTFNIGGRQRKAHRLVAEAFIPNPDNLPEVNHKDHDRTNNHKDNLEWCTRKENNAHSLHLVIESCAKGYVFVSPDGVSTTVFNLRDFCRRNNLQQAHMVKVDKGIYKQHKGWTKYATN